MLSTALSPSQSSLGLPSPTFTPIASPFASPNTSLRPSQRNASTLSRTRTTSVKRSLAVSVSLARGLLVAQAQQPPSPSVAAIAEGSAPPSEDSRSGDGFSGSGRGGKKIGRNWDSSMSDGDSSSRGGSGQLIEPPFQEGDILTTGKALPGSGCEDPLVPVDGLDLPKSPRLENLQPASTFTPTSNHLNGYTPTPSPLSNGHHKSAGHVATATPSPPAPLFPPGLGLDASSWRKPAHAPSPPPPPPPYPPPAPPKVSFATPSRLEIVRKLGRGSYAVVYLVREVLGDPNSERDDDEEWDMEGEDGIVGVGGGQGKGRQYGREFALKCLSKQDLSEESLEVQMFEATIHQSLPQHPNIVTLYQTLQTPQWLFLVLEMCTGEDLYYWLERSKPPPDSTGTPPSASTNGGTGGDHHGSAPHINHIHHHVHGHPIHHRPNGHSPSSPINHPSHPLSISPLHHLHPAPGGSSLNYPSSSLLSGSAFTPPTPSLLSALPAPLLLAPHRVRLIASMFGQMCAAVQVCHDTGVSHRDIKPENVIVTEEKSWMRGRGRVVCKLTDFGLATTEEESEDVECGSRPYMAVECRNNLSPSYRPPPADVWSLGIVLINMLFHKNPWSDPAPTCAPFQSFRADPKGFLQGKFPGMGEEVAGYLAEKVLAWDPEDRVSAGEFGKWVSKLGQMLTPKKIMPAGSPKGGPGGGGGGDGGGGGGGGGKKGPVRGAFEVEKRQVPRLNGNGTNGSSAKSPPIQQNGGFGKKWDYETSPIPSFSTLTSSAPPTPELANAAPKPLDLFNASLSHRTTSVVPFRFSVDDDDAPLPSPTFTPRLPTALPASLASPTTSPRPPSSLTSPVLASPVFSNSGSSSLLVASLTSPLTGSAPPSRFGIDEDDDPLPSPTFTPRLPAALPVALPDDAHLAEPSADSLSPTSPAQHQQSSFTLPPSPPDSPTTDLPKTTSPDSPEAGSTLPSEASNSPVSLPMSPPASERRSFTSPASPLQPFHNDADSSVPSPLPETESQIEDEGSQSTSSVVAKRRKRGARKGKAAQAAAAAAAAALTSGAETEEGEKVVEERIVVDGGIGLSNGMVIGGREATTRALAIASQTLAREISAMNPRSSNTSMSPPALRRPNGSAATSSTLASFGQPVPTPNNVRSSSSSAGSVESLHHFSSAYSRSSSATRKTTTDLEALRALAKEREAGSARGGQSRGRAVERGGHGGGGGWSSNSPRRMVSPANSTASSINSIQSNRSDAVTSWRKEPASAAAPKVDSTPSCPPISSPPPVETRDAASGGATRGVRKILTARRPVAPSSSSSIQSATMASSSASFVSYTTTNNMTYNTSDLPPLPVHSHSASASTSPPQSIFSERSSTSSYATSANSSFQSSQKGSSLWSSGAGGGPGSGLMKSNVKQMDGVPYQLDQLPRHHHQPTPSGQLTQSDDIFSKPRLTSASTSTTGTGPGVKAPKVSSRGSASSASGCGSSSILHPISEKPKRHLLPSSSSASTSSQLSSSRSTASTSNSPSLSNQHHTSSPNSSLPIATPLSSSHSIPTSIPTSSPLLPIAAAAAAASTPAAVPQPPSPSGSSSTDKRPAKLRGLKSMLSSFKSGKKSVIDAA